MAQIIKLNAHPRFLKNKNIEAAALCLARHNGTRPLCQPQPSPQPPSDEVQRPERLYSLSHFRSVLIRFIEDHEEDGLDISKVRLLHINSDETPSESAQGKNQLSLAFIIIDYRTDNTVMSNDLFVSALIVEKPSDIRRVKKMVHDICAVEAECT